MTNFALISTIENRVLETGVNPFEVHESFKWIPVSDDFDITYKSWDGEKIVDNKPTNTYDSENAPTLVMDGEFVFNYTFSKGNELSEHNHLQGGRHISEVQSGTFEVKRLVDGSWVSETLKAGGVTTFTREETHAIVAKTKGVLINTTIQESLPLFQFRYQLDAAGYKFDESKFDAVTKAAITYGSTVGIDGVVVKAVKEQLSLSNLDIDKIFAVKEVFKA